MITKEKIKSSLSAKWHLHNLATYGVVGAIYGIVMLFIAIFASLMHEGGFILALSITGGIFLFFTLAISPFVIYEAYRYRSLFKSIDKYELCEARLDRPSTSYCGRGAIYYTVSFKTSDGESVTADTRAMWSSAPFAQNQLADYNNKTVSLAYDKENDRLVVLGLKK